jgi:hypothetical protein
MGAYSVRVDITGQRFGRLSVIAPVEGTHPLRWLCRCDCGKTVKPFGRNLRGGLTQSCGCLSADKASVRNSTHGMTRLKAYQSWFDARARCHDPKDPAFWRYGGRGITMCDRWREDVTAFCVDMGERPKGYTLERIDNSKGYSPENCVWASRWEQMQNTRMTRMLTHNGITLSRSQWERRLHLKPGTIRSRMRIGWSLERVLTTTGTHEAT